MNTKEALDTVKRAKMVTPDNQHIKIYHELADEISVITDNFENPEKLSDHKFDMTDILKTEGVSRLGHLTEKR